MGCALTSFLTPAEDVTLTLASRVSETSMYALCACQDESITWLHADCKGEGDQGLYCFHQHHETLHACHDMRALPACMQLEQEKLGKGEEPAGPDAFDSNCITPGTPFMQRLGEHLRFFIRKKIAEDPAWQVPVIVFSGAACKSALMPCMLQGQHMDRPFICQGAPPRTLAHSAAGALHSLCFQHITRICQASERSRS